MKITSVILSFFACLNMAHAEIQDAKTKDGKLKVSASTEVRYDHIVINGKTTQDREQGRIRIGIVYDLGGNFELVGMIATGPSYNNDWVNVHNNMNADEDLKVPLYFRQFYLQKHWDKNSLSVGALEGIDTVGSAGGGTSGWIDGLRFTHKLDAGEVKVIVGSVTDYNNPNAFTRDHKLNFVELEVSHQVFKQLLIKSGYEKFDGDDYLKQKVKVNVSTFGKNVLDLTAEVLYNVQKNAANYEVGANWDILKTFMHGYDNYLKFDIYYSYLSYEQHDRNTLYNIYYQDGNMITFRLYGKIDKAGKVNWFIRRSGGNNSSRTDIGLQFKF